MSGALSPGEIDAVSALALAQNQRRLLADGRIPRPEPDQVAADLARRVHDRLIWSTHYAGAGATGVAIPVVIEYPHNSDALAYWPQRSGTTAGVYVSGDSETECRSTFSCLLRQLNSHWNSFTPEGVSLLWPTQDFEAADTLSEIGIELDAFFATRNAVGPSLPHVKRQDLIIRPAAPPDLPFLIGLAEEVVAAHVPHSPFARLTPSIGPRYRDRLMAQWEKRTVDGYQPLSFVAEMQKQIVGMADCRIVEERPCVDTLVHHGRYLYVNSFGVAKSFRGNGIGTALADHLHRTVLLEGCVGSYLWFSAYNQPASRFWRRAGYVPLWTSFQRREH